MPQPGSPLNYIRKTPLSPERGAGEEFLKSAAGSAGPSAGNKGSVGKSAGSSAALLFSTRNGTASSTLSALRLFPALVLAVLAALFRNSPPAPLSGANGVLKLYLYEFGVRG